jgi:hypothetical protein
LILDEDFDFENQRIRLGRVANFRDEEESRFLDFRFERGIVWQVPLRVKWDRRRFGTEEESRFTYSRG